MASNSKSTTLYPSSGYGYTLYCGFSEENLTDTQISTNKTKINANGYIKANGTYWATSHLSYLVLYWHDNKENKDIEIARNEFGGLSSTTDSRSVSASFEITHKDDGTLSGYVWIAFTKGNTGTAYAPASGSVGTDWTTLTTIPRATIISNQTLVIGTSSTISWTKASSTFKHTLTYEFGTLKGTIGTEKSLIDSVDWNPPDIFYSMIKEAQNGIGTLYLTTYDGNTQIGDTKTATLTIKADESKSNAVITSNSIRDENPATKALTGDLSVLVLHNSLAFIELVFNTRQYATAKKVTVNGIEMEMSSGTLQNDNTTTQYVVQQDVGKATSPTFKIAITDSRNFVTEATITAEVVNYIPLDCNPKIRRTNPTTGEVGLTFEGKYFNSTFGDVANSLKINYAYKEKTATSYSNTVVLTKDTHYKISNNTYFSGNENSASELILSQLFDYKKEYNVILNVEDALTKLVIILDIIKGIPIFWWNGEKVTINGDLFVADENGENPINVKEMSGGIEIVRWENE